MNRGIKLAFAALGAVPVAAVAQVPDLISALDAGGRAMGMGGATYMTGADTLAGYYNPAGLGFVTRGTLDLTLRNMPESNTVVTGDIGPGGTQRLSTEGDKGPSGLGHAGIAFPLKGNNGGTNGTIALTLTKGGQIRDTRTAGAGLTEGGLPAPGYREFTKVTTDFINLSYGRSNSDGTFNWGFGLVYAVNRQVNNRTAPSGTTLFDAEASGIGAQIGVLFSPKGNANTSFGLSVRTPIKLKGGSGGLIYPRVPGRLGAGIAVRQDGFRKGRDYMVFGADVQHFFGGDTSNFVDRDKQTVFGLGTEYSYSFGGGRIPLRVGYSFVQAGGAAFGTRNGFTFGLGYRPANNDWGIDLNWARPESGGNDLSIGLSYKFGK
jgi:hypothetical protein